MSKITPALAHLINKFCKMYVGQDDRVLLNLVFAENPTQQMLDAAIRVCDIEALGGDKSILLSYLMHDRPNLKFPKYAGPRIKGLITFYRFANMKVLSHLSKIGRGLNEAHIPMFLFKGGAMKVLRAALPRPMGDVDVLVPRERFAEAVRIGEGLGYLHTREDSLHAVDFHTETESAVDVHHSIFDPDRDLSLFHKNLWARATPRRAFGVDFMLPAHEDLFFLVLSNFTKNLREHTSLGGLYYALCDSKFLMFDKADLDWDVVWKDAVNSGRELEVRFAAEFMNAIVPGFIPDMDARLPLTRDTDFFCNQVIFDEEFYLKRQLACQQIRVVELKNHPWRYGKQILKFIILKKLRHRPAFVRWYLRTRLRREE